MCLNMYRTISHSGLFYCHPQLLRSLGVHLTVLGLMRSYLGIRVAGLEDDSFLTARRKMKMAMSKVGALPTHEYVMLTASLFLSPKFMHILCLVVSPDS